jgi:N-acetylglucosamine kinase-like BadF-type ATPase
VLPAAGLTDGIAVLAGTGSVAVGSCGDRHLQTGGWGYLLGDEGSGYWIVKRAVHLLLDASSAESRHQGLLLKHLQETTCTDSLGSLLQYLYDNPQPRKWAAAAPAVFAAAADGDTLAGDVVASAAHHLAGYALRLQAELGENLPVVLAGGVLTSQPDLAGRVESLLLAEGFADVSVLRHPPVAGAVRLAEVAADRAATQSKATSSH